MQDHRTYLLLSIPAKLLAEAVPKELEGRGYRRTGAHGRWTLDFAHDETSDGEVLHSAHTLRVKVTDEGGGSSLVDFRFKFPSDRRCETRQVALWVLDVRDKALAYLFPRASPGVISPDGTEVHFTGPSPVFYHPAFLNLVTSRARTWRRRVHLIAPLPPILFATAALAAFILGNLVFGRLLAGLGLMVAITIWAVLTVAGMSWKAPLSIAMTLDALVLFFKRKKDIIPWDRVVSWVQLPQPAFNFLDAEYKVFYRGASGKQNFFVINSELFPRLQECLDLSRERSTVDLGSYEFWNAAPPGSRVEVTPVPLSENVLSIRSLSRRQPYRGNSEWVYLNADEESRIRRRLIDSVPGDRDLLMKLGHDAIVRESWEVAEIAWRRILSSEPEALEALTNLAGSLMRMGRTNEAKALIEPRIISSEEPSRLYALMASISQSEGDTANALGFIGRAVDANPNNLDALHMWFDLVAASDGIAHALAELDIVGGTHPDAWGPPLVTASRLRWASPGTAKAHFDMALSRALNADTVGGYLQFLIETKDVSTAISVAERALSANDPLDPQAWYFVASALLAGGQRESAREAIRHIDLVKSPQWRRLATELESA